MTKFCAAASPTAVTAALQGTPWRGDTPRRGLSASSCSDWDGPQLVRSTMGALSEELLHYWGVALVTLEWGAGSTGVLLADTVEIRHSAHSCNHPCQS